MHLLHLSASSCRRGGNVRRVSLAAAAGTVEQQQRTVLQLGGRSGCRNGDSSEQQQTQASVVPQPSLAIDGRTIATWHPRQGYQAEHTAIHRVNVFPVRTGLLPPQLRPLLRAVETQTPPTPPLSKKPQRTQSPLQRQDRKRIERSSTKHTQTYSHADTAFTNVIP